MWEKLLLNLALMLIEKLVEAAGKELLRIRDKEKKDATNKANLEDYQKAEDRLEKIKAAKNLLNGTRP